MGYIVKRYVNVILFRIYMREKKMHKVVQVHL